MENEFIGSNSPLEMSMEARSILKSIQTEDSKLSQASVPTRSDFHYFRARYNYYRLSILRLPENERGAIEPALNHFLERINRTERGEGTWAGNSRPQPFLEAVKPGSSKASEFSADSRPEVSSSRVVAPALPSMDGVLQQLLVLKMAMEASPSPEGQKALSSVVDSVMSQLRAFGDRG